jgi:hypothetical protein
LVPPYYLTELADFVLDRDSGAVLLRYDLVAQYTVRANTGIAAFLLQLGSFWVVVASSSYPINTAIEI